jgi:glyoxylase-like metal-dependent hydrolase (beta-lactamase superfamily II)
VTTTGNPTLIAYDNSPVLVTDPRIDHEEPAYFASWVLSHTITRELKHGIYQAEYVRFSHGHPDHLNPTSLERFRARKILLPDHVGLRILKDISPLDYRVSVLPDRE